MRSFFFFAAIALCLSSCGQGNGTTAESSAKGQKATTIREAIAVKVQELNKEQYCSVKSYVGLARASKSTLINAGVSGSLASVQVKAGEKVTKGQTLAIINSPNIKSAHTIAHASLSQAQDGYNRAQKVYSTGSITEVQMKEISTKLEQAKAAAAAADEALANCTLTAPYDAFVEQLFASEGEQIEIFSPVAKLLDINQIQIDFSVPENEISKIKEGSQVSIDVPAAELEGLPATISSKGISASPLAHSYSCIATMQKQDDGLLPGMVCRVYAKAESGRAMLVPPHVVQVDASGRYVWVVEEGLAQKRRVEVGGFSGSEVLVTQGLRKGDLLVVQGYQKISTGMKVSVQK